MGKILKMFSWRRRKEHDLDRELQYHIDRRIDDLTRSGLAENEAQREASLEFGGIGQVKEEVRDAWKARLLWDLIEDLRYGSRVLLKNPGFAIVAIVSLALGIGANSAIFSVINTVTLRTLPVDAPDELFELRRQGQGVSNLRFSYPMFEELRGALGDTASIAAMSRVSLMQAQLEGNTETEFINVQLVSGEYFQTLEIQAPLGRTPDPENPVALISDAFWRRRFGSSSEVVGRTLTLNGTRFTIVGVGTRSFSGVWLEAPTDIWIPLAMQSNVGYAQNYSANGADLQKSWLAQNNIWWLDLIIRTKHADASIAILNTVFQRLISGAAQRIEDPVERQRVREQRVGFEPFGRGLSRLRQRFVSPLNVLMAMVALLLLIACANTANLLLARASARQREITMRQALGANRMRLIRQLLTESLLLAVLAGSAGLSLAPWLSNLLIHQAAGSTTTATPFSATVDTNVLLFTAGLSLITTLLFGLAPAFRMVRLELAAPLQGSARSIHGSGRISLAKLLVVSQVALSTLLIVGAALSIRSFRNLLHIELGFDQEHVISVRLRTASAPKGSPRAGTYPAEELPLLYGRLIEAAKSIRGVESATFAMCGIANGCRANDDGTVVDGYVKAPGERILIQYNLVGPQYFSTVGMRLLAGRDFDARDSRTGANVAIINEAMVRRYFQGRTAIGGRFELGKPGWEVIGIVRDARVNTPREAAVPMAYLVSDGRLPGLHLEVRAGADPQTVIPQLRAALLDVDRNLPIERISTLSDHVSSTLNSERLIAGLTASFGSLALGLACFGLYGVMSYAVARRKSELGLRLALGASQGQVLWKIFRESLLLVVLGLSIGTALVYLARRFLSTLIFGIEPSDPSTILASMLILIVVAAAAACFPAWRASRVDPMVALRSE